MPSLVTSSTPSLASGISMLAFAGTLSANAAVTPTSLLIPTRGIDNDELELAAIDEVVSLCHPLLRGEHQRAAQRALEREEERERRAKGGERKAQRGNGGRDVSSRRAGQAGDRRRSWIEWAEDSLYGYGLVGRGVEQGAGRQVLVKAAMNMRTASRRLSAVYTAADRARGAMTVRGALVSTEDCSLTNDGGGSARARAVPLVSSLSSRPAAATLCTVLTRMIRMAVR
jgi:hypothetical protein